jgi:hypothetical protein
VTLDKKQTLVEATKVVWEALKLDKVLDKGDAAVKLENVRLRSWNMAYSMAQETFEGEEQTTLGTLRWFSHKNVMLEARTAGEEWVAYDPHSLVIKVVQFRHFEQTDASGGGTNREEADEEEGEAETRARGEFLPPVLVSVPKKAALREFKRLASDALRKSARNSSLEPGAMRVWRLSPASSWLNKAEELLGDSRSIVSEFRVMEGGSLHVEAKEAVSVEEPEELETELEAEEVQKGEKLKQTFLDLTQAAPPVAEHRGDEEEDEQRRAKALANHLEVNVFRHPASPEELAEATLKTIATDKKHTLNAATRLAWTAWGLKRKEVDVKDVRLRAWDRASGKAVPSSWEGQGKIKLGEAGWTGGQDVVLEVRDASTGWEGGPGSSLQANVETASATLAASATLGPGGEPGRESGGESGHGVVQREQLAASIREAFAADAVDDVAPASVNSALVREYERQVHTISLNLTLCIPRAPLTDGPGEGAEGASKGADTAAPVNGAVPVGLPMARTIKIDRRKPMMHLKERVAQMVGVGTDGFKMKRTNEEGFEFKNLAESLQKANLADNG